MGYKYVKVILICRTLIIRRKYKLSITAMKMLLFSGTRTQKGRDEPVKEYW